MKKLIVAALAATLALGGAALQADTASPKTPTKTSAAKLIDVKVCPITGAKVIGSGGGSEVVDGKYKVFFCCPGCQPEFDKLTAAQKLAKVKTLAKKS